MMKGILIVDDHSVTRAGLPPLLDDEAELQIVGEAAYGEEAISFAADLQPGLVLMDISLPILGCIDAIHRLVDLYPQMKILILTVHEDKSLLQEAIRAGAAG